MKLQAIGDPTVKKLPQITDKKMTAICKIRQN